MLENGLWFKNGKLFTGTVIHGPVSGFPNGFMREKIRNVLLNNLRNK